MARHFVRAVLVLFALALSRGGAAAELKPISDFEGGRRYGQMHKDGTIYQVVAVPSQLKLWLKTLGYGDWIEFDLNQLFK